MWSFGEWSGGRDRRAANGPGGNPRGRPTLPGLAKPQTRPPGRAWSCRGEVNAKAPRRQGAKKWMGMGCSPPLRPCALASLRFSLTPEGARPPLWRTHLGILLPCQPTVCASLTSVLPFRLPLPREGRDFQGRRHGGGEGGGEGWGEGANTRIAGSPSPRPSSPTAAISPTGTSPVGEREQSSENHRR